MIAARAPKTWKGWTAKEAKRLEELRGQGMTLPAIAGELGRSLPSVKCKARELGTCDPRLRFWQWHDALCVPHVLAEVARRMGTTIWAAKRWKVRLRGLGFEVAAARRSP